MTHFKLLSSLLCLSLAAGCHNHQDDNSETEHVHGTGYAQWIKGPSSAPLSPADSLKSFNIQTGLKIELYAAEPLVQDPVAIAFDAKGRAWVAEMTNFMLDVAGTGQHDRRGNIVIVEDSDGDNVADKRTVLLSDVVLPRTIAHVAGGILFGDNSALYYVAVEDDRAGMPIVVDASYASGGNVEHKPNGLLLGPDNWLYNAESDKRYRLFPHSQEIPAYAEVIFTHKDWKLARAATEYRGQWGITTDDYGRLFYNRNSFPLMTDSFPPNIRERNKNYTIANKVATRLSGTKVYPARPNLGLNRVYDKERLTSDNRMKNADAISGPVIFRGTTLPDFYGHAIFPEPGGNLVGAIRISDKDGKVSGKPFFNQTELLTSFDERFRPVNTYTAPDGSLFIVDMYRGIIQDRSYLSQYLSKYIQAKELDRGVHMGRIYRIRQPDIALTQVTDLNALSSKDLVKTLTHNNGWWRDTARRLLIQRQDQTVIADLEKLALQAQQDYIRLGALWTLEGVQGLTGKLLAGLITDPSNKVKSHAIRLGGQVSREQQLAIMAAIKTGGLAQTNSYELAVELAAALPNYQDDHALKMLATIVSNWQQRPLINAIALSGLQGFEKDFIAKLDNVQAQTKMAAIFNVPRPKKKATASHLKGLELAVYNRGIKIYKTKGACVGCHGKNGEGIDYAGPPLAGSEWVLGSPERLAALLLHGMTGPVHVKGKLYDPGFVMPGMAGSNAVTIPEMTALMAYLRNSWGNKASILSFSEVFEVNKATEGRSLPYTEAELKEQFKTQ